MARITVEDCIKEGDSYFELAYTAARRAREILRRGNPQVAENDDKAIVVALREAADKIQNGDEMEQTNPLTQTEETAAAAADDADSTPQ